MLTWNDCVELSELTEDEIDAIAQHEHIPEMIALEMGTYLIHTHSGEKRVKAMIRDDIRLAEEEGKTERVAMPRMVLTPRTAGMFQTSGWSENRARS